MSVGQRVEVSLTGLRGRQGLWHAYYPGTIVARNPWIGFYRVQLDQFISIWLADYRVYPTRIADRVHPCPGLRVDVRVPDESTGGAPVDVWWTGTLTTSVSNRSNGWSNEYWLVQWDYQGSDEDKDRAMYSGMMRTHAPMDWKPLRIPRACIRCNVVTLRRFANSSYCPHCFLERREKALAPLGHGRGHSRRYKAARTWTLQLGGLSRKRDVRLLRQLKKNRVVGL